MAVPRGSASIETLKCLETWSSVGEQGEERGSGASTSTFSTTSFPVLLELWCDRLRRLQPFKLYRHSPALSLVVDEAVVVLVTLRDFHLSPLRQQALGPGTEYSDEREGTAQRNRGRRVALPWYVSSDSPPHRTNPLIFDFSADPLDDSHSRSLRTTLSARQGRGASRYLRLRFCSGCPAVLSSSQSFSAWTLSCPSLFALLANERRTASIHRPIPPWQIWLLQAFLATFLVALFVLDSLPFHHDSQSTTLVVLSLAWRWCRRAASKVLL